MKLKPENRSIEDAIYEQHQEKKMQLEMNY